MALSVNGGGNGSRYGSRRRGTTATLSEINVTPFVDVVLVLLIIFMLTAHVMEFGMRGGRTQGAAGKRHRQGNAGGLDHQGRHYVPQ